MFMVKVIRNKSLYLLILAELLLPASNAFADGNTTDFSITVNPSLSLSVSSGTVSFEITPTQAGSYNSATFNVYSSTNNVTGYTLTMSTNKVNLESNTVNPNTGANPTIPTITETQAGITAAQFEASTDSNILNHYGVSIAGANYNAMKASSQVKRTTENNTSQDTTAIALASKLDLLTVPGIYSTTLNFSLVANPIDPVQPYPVDPCISNPNCDATSGVTLQRAYELAYTAAHKGMYEEITPGSNTYQYINSWNGVQYQGNGRDVRFLIQDMTPEICAAATAINSEALVLDIRDQKSYWIAKLADGNCWMTQNLDLDLVTDGSITYSPSNTDIPTGGNWVPDIATNTTAEYWDCDGYCFSEPTSYDPGDLCWNGVVDDSFGTGLEDGTASCAQSGSHYHIGNYYNWPAAVAMNDSSSYTAQNTDVGQSICPAGWRLPAYNGNKSFGNLVSELDLPSGSGNDIVLAPVYFVYAGYSLGSGAGNFSSAGYYWLSGVSDQWYAYDYGYTAYGSGGEAASERYLGSSIRCIAR